MNSRTSTFLISLLIFNFYSFGQNVVGSFTSETPFENGSFSIVGGIGIQTYDSYELKEVTEEVVDTISEKEHVLIAFPNPSSDYIQFSKLEDDKLTQGKYKAQILNFSGGLIRTFENVSAKDQIDVSLLPNGIYLLHLTELNTGERKAFKFIK